MRPVYTPLPVTYPPGTQIPSEMDGWLFNRSAICYILTECFDTTMLLGHSVSSEWLKWAQIWYGIKGPISPQVTDNSSYSSAASFWLGAQRKTDMAWNPERGIHLAASTLWLQTRHRPLIFPLAARVEEILPKPTGLMMFKKEQCGWHMLFLPPPSTGASVSLIRANLRLAAVHLPLSLRRIHINVVLWPSYPLLAS